MSFIKLCVNRPVAVLMGILITVFVGIISVININMDMMPNVNIPILSVHTSYAGAGSEEMENLITIPLENILSTVEGVKSIQSTSGNERSNIIINFENDIDIDVAALNVREKVDIINNRLPDGATKPMVSKFDLSKLEEVIYGITSDNKSLENLEIIVEEEIVPMITKISGVANVSVRGGQEEEIVIEIKEDKMRGYGILESDLRNAIAMGNIVMPIGSVKDGENNLTIKVDGGIKSIEAIENIRLRTPLGGEIRVSDIANVEKKYKKQTSKTYTNHKNGIILVITKQSTANTVDVSKSVIKEMNKIRKLNDELEITSIVDTGEFIQEAISGVGITALIGMLIAMFVIYMFLGDGKTTLIIALAMPISVMATFIFMYYNDVTINIISLGGLTLGIGMLVDNSIVVIESIYRKVEGGLESKIASIEGTKEVALSIIASTLTTVVVFLPITFTTSVVSDLFMALSFTITFSLLSSLIVAITFVPMLSAILFKNGINKERIGVVQKFNIGFEKLKTKYLAILNKSLVKRKRTYLVTIIFIMLTGLTVILTGTGFFPEIDEGVVFITSKFPDGTPYVRAEEVNEQLENLIKDEDYIESVASVVRMGDTTSLDFFIRLVGINERDKSSAEIAKEIEEGFNDIAGVDLEASSSGGSMGGLGASGATIIVKGLDVAVINEIVNDIIKFANEIEGVGEVTSNIQQQSRQIKIKVDEDKGRMYGINMSILGDTLRTAISGTKATIYKEEGSEIDIVIRRDEESIKYIDDLGNILIPTLRGASVPLSEIGEITIESTPISISRKDQERYVEINIGLGSNDTGTIIKEMTRKLENYSMPSGYSWENAGTSKEMIDAFKQLFLAVLAAIALVYMVMAGNFESLKYPFIVMFSIPVAIATAIFGIFLIGEQINITTFIGFIMLTGIVINNAIVLIDYTNLLIRERGYNAYDGLLKAGEVRFRPILMSTLTTVLGLLPMLLSTQEGSEAMKNIALTVILGLTFSTVVTLVLIPTIYLSMDDLYKKRRGI